MLSKNIIKCVYYVCVCVCVHVSVRVCACVHAVITSHIIFVCLCIMCTVGVYIYIYIYIYYNMYIYIFIYYNIYIYKYTFILYCILLRGVTITGWIDVNAVASGCTGVPNKVPLHVTCVCVPLDPQAKREDTLVLKLGSLSMAPQADNPLTRTVLRKDIYQ